MKCTAYKNGDRIEVWLGFNRTLEKGPSGQYRVAHCRSFDEPDGGPALILSDEGSINRFFEILELKQRRKMEKGFIFHPNIPNSWFENRHILSKRKESRDLKAKREKFNLKIKKHVK